MFGKQSFHFAAVTSKVSLLRTLHSKDCIDVGHMRACGCISLEIMRIGNKASRHI